MPDHIRKSCVASERLLVNVFLRLSPNGQDNHNDAKVAFDDVGATSRGGMDPVEVVENVGKSFVVE
jgi:hypothetical protein